MRSLPLWLLVAALAAPAAATAAPPVFRTVTFGDSYASGEGAPAVAGSYGSNGANFDTSNPADWNGGSADTALTGDSASAARRCHRSPKATSPQAVLRLRSSFPEIAFTFRSFACSGARVNEGILGTFEGAEPKDEVNRVPKQITQANDYLDDLDENRRIDALVMNIGGNNLGFGNIIQRCTNLPPFFFDPCSPGDVSFGGNDDTKNVLLTGAGSGEDEGDMGVDDLPRLYRQLDDVIDRRAASGKLAVAPRSVFLTGPPNPLAGGFTGCLTGDHDYEKNIRADERGWLNDFVYPKLRSSISDGATANGWTFVDTSPAVPNGICAPSGRMINRNRDSLPVQGATVNASANVNVSHGWVHPNASGYTAMSTVLADAMRPSVISAFTPGLPAASGPAPVKDLASRVVMRVGEPAQTYDTRAAGTRTTPAGGIVTGALGSPLVDVPVSTATETQTITVRRCGPLAPSVAPPAGCGATSNVAGVLTGTPVTPLSVSASNDALGIRVRWEKAAPTTRFVRRYLVTAKAIRPDTGLNPTDLLSDCPIEDDPRFGGDGPLVNGRPCGGPLPSSSPELDFPIETDFEFGAGIRDAVLQLAKTSRWSVTVRECTDRGCSAPSKAASAGSGLTLSGQSLQDALDRKSTGILLGDFPLGIFTTLAGRSAKRGATFPLRVAWGTWKSWRDLREMRVRLTGTRDDLGTLRVALPSGKVTYTAPGGKATLVRRSVRLAAAGSKSRLVALELPLKLSRKLARQRVDVEIAATGKGKRQDFGWAGSFAISG
jgi:hypothetical protein